MFFEDKMAVYTEGIIIVSYIIFFILYFVTRSAVEEGTYRAFKRYEEEKNSSEATMLAIGEQVKKERDKQK